MTKINWKQKLTSRKFWAAVVGFVTPLLLAFGVADSTVTQVVSIITAGASVVAYIVGEGLTDSARVTSGGSVAEQQTAESTAEGGDQK